MTTQLMPDMLNTDHYRKQLGVIIKSPKEIEAMREAGSIVGEALQKLRESVEPGITTLELDSIALGVITGHGAVPTFRGYRGFPGNICTSVNNEIVHGIPSKRALKDGDVIKMDVGATINGFIGDAAISVIAGEGSSELHRLALDTQFGLMSGIAEAKPGNRVGDIAAAIQSYGEAQGYGIVTGYGGHGLGRGLHEAPDVPNTGRAGYGVLLQPGLCIAIEPMYNLGTAETAVLDDEWTVVTKDGKLSCHFEHSIAITDDGMEILTVPR